MWRIQQVKLLLAEETESLILILTEQATKELVPSDPSLQSLIDTIESDLINAERVEGDYYDNL